MVLQHVRLDAWKGLGYASKRTFQSPYQKRFGLAWEKRAFTRKSFPNPCRISVTVVVNLDMYLRIVSAKGVPLLQIHRRLSRILHAPKLQRRTTLTLILQLIILLGLLSSKLLVTLHGSRHHKILHGNRIQKILQRITLRLQLRHGCIVRFLPALLLMRTRCMIASRQCPVPHVQIFNLKLHRWSRKFQFRLLLRIGVRLLP